MGASELQAVLAVGGGAGVFNPSTRTKSASFVDEDTFILLAGRKGLFRLSLRTRQRSIR